MGTDNVHGIELRVICSTSELPALIQCNKNYLIIVINK